MDPGRLDQRVTIQVKQSVADGGGGFTETWSDVATVWAQVLPMSGRERSQAQQVEAASVYRVTIRRRGDLTAAHRLVWKGRPMNIRWDGFVSSRRPFMTIDAEMGVAT